MVATDGLAILLKWRVTIKFTRTPIHRLSAGDVNCKSDGLAATAEFLLYGRKIIHTRQTDPTVTLETQPEFV